MSAPSASASQSSAPGEVSTTTPITHQGTLSHLTDDESSSSLFLFLFLLFLLTIVILLLPPHLAGFEAAQMFLSSREVPDIWKMDMSQILDSSSSDEEEEDEEKESDDDEEGDEEEEKKKKKHMKEEVNVHMTAGVTDAAGRVRYLPLCVCVCVSLMKSRIQRREITSCSSSTSSWRTEVRRPVSTPPVTAAMSERIVGRTPVFLAEIIRQHASVLLALLLIAASELSN